MSYGSRGGGWAAHHLAAALTLDALPLLVKRWVGTAYTTHHLLPPTDPAHNAPLKEAGAGFFFLI